jgi:regulator of protease activity HflC (stomatin/prohibitin superfamily)
MKKQFRIALFALSIMVATSCTRISVGSVGVKVNQFGTDKGVMDATECTGTVWYNPIKYDIYEFPTTIQHKEYSLTKDGDESFVVNSKDGAEFHVSPIVNYSVIPEKVVDVFKAYKKELPELEVGFIKTAVYDAFRIATNSFTSDSLISNRSAYEIKVRQLLDKELNKNGFIIHQFTSNLSYPETFKKAIEAKNAMTQQAMQAENKVKFAEANAKIQVATAEGNARSLIIQAEADATANRLRQQSLTPLLVQQQFIEKWNGVLPTYGQVPTLFKGIQ